MYGYLCVSEHVPERYPNRFGMCNRSVKTGVYTCALLCSILWFLLIYFWNVHNYDALLFLLQASHYQVYGATREIQVSVLLSTLGVQYLKFTADHFTLLHMYTCICLFLAVTGSEDSDWSNLPSETMSWPLSAGKLNAVQETGVVITSQDSLKSVLEKAGLTEYQKLFQVLLW